MPLPAAMLIHFQLYQEEQIMNEKNTIIFIQENAFENVVYKNGGHFVQVSMSYQGT